MPSCCAVKSCANKIKKGAPVSFHRFPVREPTRLRLWLLALNIDVNTDQDELKKHFVCSEHFVPGDYTSNGLPENGAVRRYLTPTAVPSVGVSPDTSTTSVQARGDSVEEGVQEDEPGSVNDRIKHELVDSCSSADTTLVSEESPPSLLQQCHIKVEQAPVTEETQVHIQVEDVQLQVKHEDTKLVSEELPPSLLQQCYIKLERVPIPEETHVHIQVKDVRLQQCDVKVEQAPIPEETQVQIQVKDVQLQWSHVKVEEDGVPEETEINTQITEKQSPGIELFVERDQPVMEEKSCHLCDTKLVSEELPPSLLQQCDIKVEQAPVPEETDVHIQVEDVLPPGCDVKVEEDAAQEETEMNKQVTEEQVDQSPGIEVFVEADQPAMEEKSCHLCGKTFKKCSYLMRHVKKSHKGHKAFKCPECNREFDQQYQLVLHIRTHTGEKPFTCDHCGKAFSQNSSRVTHMRRHTGEKPYFCARCGKSFTTSNHLRFCKMQSASKVTLEKEDTEEKPFKCPECNKVFNNNHHLIQHLRVHTGERPFSCDWCGKTFTQVSSRNVHIRQHTGEKPYFCDKCGNMVASKHHLKCCPGTNPKKSKKKFLCTTCGKRFQTKSNLKIHKEVHKSWQRHINEKLQG